MNEKRPEPVDNKEMLKLFREIIDNLKDENESFLLGVIDYINKKKEEKTEKEEKPRKK